MSDDWREAVQRSGRFSEYEWSEEISIEVSTLDAEIGRHGVPAFCKIDVEGYEYEVLRGLSRPVPALSIEYTHEQADVTADCLRHLSSLGDYAFSFSAGETMRLWRRGWSGMGDTLQGLSGLRGDLPWGDVYARLH